MNKRFTLSMRRIIINGCIDKIKNGDGMSRHSHATSLEDKKREVMGCEVPDTDMSFSQSHADQQLAKVWRFRREDSINLALQLSLFNSVQTPTSIAGNNFNTSSYATTWRGRLYMRMPSYVQIGFLGICVLGQRVAATANRFKWVTGIASFVALALKVWHSALISNVWIAISVGIGLAVGLLASLWG